MQEDSDELGANNNSCEIAHTKREMQIPKHLLVDQSDKSIHIDYTDNQSKDN